MAKKPKKKRPLTAKQRRYAIAAARGLNKRQAAEKAGYKGARARKSVTGAELERDPRIQELMRIEVARDMDEATTRGLLAAQARGEVPTKIVRGTDGVRVEHDTHAAAESVARIQGQFKDHTRVDFGADPDAAYEEIRMLLAAFGVTATDDEIKAALERVGEPESDRA
jgi:phage terminase small subunit